MMMYLQYQSGAEWYGGGGRGEEGREEVENNRERATEEEQEECKLQNNEANTYAKEKEENKGIIRKYQE